MSSESEWSVRSIIERVEAERPRRTRRRPTPHRRRACGAWRYGMTLLALAFFGDGTTGLGGRHALR
ncbi:hypothetical protein [Nocardia yunnanensis]|nr:hypothetical protein [Nocardia yunnanensis]